MEINVSIQEIKFIAWHLCSRALNMLLPRVIAERAIHHVIVMDGWSFGQSQ